MKQPTSPTHPLARALIYCRVSTEGQERDGSSLVTQEAACRSYAAAQGYVVLRSLSDSASGSSLDRPGLSEVRRLVRAGEVDVVIAFSLDRLSRSQNHVGILDDECQRRGCRLEFATERFEDTPVGRFVRAARAFTDELEREKIRERTMRGKRQRATQGYLVQGTGRGIFGYDLSARGTGGNGRRTVNQRQASVVQRIFFEFVNGASFQAIANSLNADGIETLLGWRQSESAASATKVRWHPLTIRRILMNPAYKGTTYFGRTTVATQPDARTGKRKRRVLSRPAEEWIEIPNATPAIVTERVWDRAQELLASPPVRSRRGHAVYPYPLRGHVRCANCEGPLSGSALSGGSGRSPIRYYTCRKRFAAEGSERCSSRYVRAVPLESSLLSGLQELLSDPARIRAAYSSARAGARPNQLSIEAAERDLAKAKSEMERLARMARLVADSSAEEALAREMRIASEDKRRADARLRELRELAHPVTIPDDDAGLGVIADRIRSWLADDPGHLEEALEGLGITVWADGVARPRVTGSIPLLDTHAGDSDADVCRVVSKNRELTDYFDLVRRGTNLQR